MFDLVTRDIKFISGVGPQKAAVLNKELGIYSLHDLICYFPYKYVDRSRIYYIHEIDGNMPYIQLVSKRSVKAGSVVSQLISRMVRESWTWCGFRE